MEPLQQRDTKGMVGRYVLFIVLSIGILVLSFLFNPPKPPGPEADRQEGQEEGTEKGKVQGKEAAKPEAPGKEGESTPGPDRPEAAAPKKPKPKPRVKMPPRVAPKPRSLTLGSLDPKSGFGMLATFTNVGAAPQRIELNSPRYGDLEDRSGYMGHVVRDKTVQGKGCPVDVVGPGTPAAQAGLKRGDVITAVDGRPVTGFGSLQAELQETKPGQVVTLTVDRNGKWLTVPVTLGWRPLEVVRPEADDPLSFLLTLSQVDGPDIDGQKLKDLIPDEEKAEEEEKKKEKNADKPRDENLGLELAGLDLRTGTWDIENEEQFDQPGPHSEVTFFRELPEFGLKISKTFRLARVPEDKQDGANYGAYHLVLSIKIENIGQQVREFAYQLDGPTGLPTEGKWYAYKISREWFQSAGLRDVVVSWGGDPEVISCGTIAEDERTLWKEQEEREGQREQLLAYIGVDAQYFAVVLIPEQKEGKVRFAELQPIRVGRVDKDWRKITNTSCRITSVVYKLEPGGEPLEHTFTIFAGPKKPPLLAEYGLKDLLYYGWYWWAAIPMLHTLHFFHDYVAFNYGLAIVMLTILVRSCMFPLSRKQALGARKMQELQPELKKIHEKYKNNLEARARAQRELFKKHNYHPLSGCLVLFFQLPIFVGLYRGLMVDVELRQAPLISEAVRWCSNLAAPDMLFNWSGFMPAFIARNPGFGYLGPYFNLLPILTVVLFVLQQKMFMPPAADEQQAMQQRVMKFMMIFMGFIFFKVASGLCLYFIASSLWGLAERKLLPKTSPGSPGEKPKASKRQPTRLPQPEPAEPEPAEPEPAEPEPAEAEPARPGPVRAKASGVGSNPGRAGGRKRKKKKKRRRGRGRK